MMDAEMPTVWHEREPRARKQHICCECGRTISVGQIYVLHEKQAIPRRYDNARR